MQKIVFIFKLAKRNLILNYRKNLMALFSLVAGFMSINLFEGYMSGAKNLFNEAYEQRFMYGDFIIHHQEAYQNSIFFDGKSYIPLNQQNQILKRLLEINEIEIFMRRLSFTGMISNGELTTQIIGEGIDVVQGEKMRQPTWSWNVLAGRPIQETGGDALLGEELGRLLNCKVHPGEQFLDPNGGYIPKERKLNCPRSQVQITANTDSGSVNAIFLKSVGVSNVLYRELDSRFIQTNLTDAQSLLNTNGISLISIKLKKGVNKNEILNKIRNQIDRDSLPLVIHPWKESAFGEIYRQSMSFLNVLRGFFLVVILVIVTFSIMATQTRMVFERIKETATLRSLGFSETLISHIFISEAFLLALGGSLLGSIGSVLASITIKKIGFFYLIGILSEEVPFHIAIIGSNFLYSGLVLVSLSIVACYIPVKKTLSLSISEAFSYS